MYLVDTHCHLNLPEFEADLAEVLGRAAEAQVRRIVVPGVDLASSRRALDLAEREAGVFAAVGVHPHAAAAWAPHSEAELRAMARSPRVVGIGEIGLDYARRISTEDEQVRALLAQLDLAADLELPVILHQRESIQPLLRMVEDWSARTGSPRRGVFHSYSADAESAERAASLGFYFGVAGPVTFRRADDLRRVVSRLPADRIVLETDSPYLSPEPRRGRRNEPAYLSLIAEAVCRLGGPDLEALAERTSGNAARLFAWDHGTGDRNIL